MNTVKGSQGTEHGYRTSLENNQNKTRRLRSQLSCYRREGRVFQRDNCELSNSKRPKDLMASSSQYRTQTNLGSLPTEKGSSSATPDHLKQVFCAAEPKQPSVLRKRSCLIKRRWELDVVAHALIPALRQADL